MLTARFFTVAFFEEWSQRESEPFLTATQQIVGAQGICRFLELLRIAAFEECIGTLLKIDAFDAHAVSQPMVSI